jgi:ABC-type glycerol-3-phosphate transport system substrate-binding protein
MDTSQMNRRRFLQTAATVAGAATLGETLIACGSTSGGTSASTVTLNYWDYFVSQAPWVDNEIKLFQKAHPNIKIKKTTKVTDTYANLFALAVQSNNEPDVFMIPGNPTLPEQVQRGWLMPLDKWATPSWRSTFPEGTFAEHSNMVGGKVYSAPISGPAPGYNFILITRFSEMQV